MVPPWSLAQGTLICSVHFQGRSFFIVLYLFFVDHTWSHEEKLGSKKREKQKQHHHNVPEEFL